MSLTQLNKKQLNSFEYRNEPPKFKNKSNTMLVERTKMHKVFDKFKVVLDVLRDMGFCYTL
jgi:hypothetical protein